MAVLPPPDPGLHFVGREDTERGARQVGILEAFGLEPSTRLLEVGCGVGRVYTRFPERVGWSMGYDHSLILGMVADAGLGFDEHIEGDWHYPWVDRGPGLHWGCDLYVLSRP